MLLNSQPTLMYIDHLKRGAGGVLSHDEGCLGLKKGSVYPSKMT